MFSETQGGDPANTANFQFDGLEMDPLLSQFAKSTEKESLLNDPLSIYVTDKVRHEPYLGRANREDCSMLFPYQQKKRAGYFMDLCKASNKERLFFYGLNS